MTFVVKKLLPEIPMISSHFANWKMEHLHLLPLTAQLFLKITKLTKHIDWINKIISLPKNRIASCSTDKTIKIWKSDYPYSNIAVLFGHKEKVISLLYIKERDVMISGASDGTLRLWNMSTYQCGSVIKGIQCCYMNSIYQYDRDTILVGGEKCIFIVSVLIGKIEKKIEDKEIGNVFSFVSLRYDKTVLFGGDSNKIGILYINTGNFIMVKTKEKIGTIDLLYIDNLRIIKLKFENIKK